jgi:hypothetical protein
MDSVLEVYAEAVTGLENVLWEMEDHISDTLHNRLTEHIDQLNDCMWAMDKGLDSLRHNLHIDGKRKLTDPINRIDYVLPEVEEELR